MSAELMNPEGKSGKLPSRGKKNTLRLHVILLQSCNLGGNFP